MQNPYRKLEFYCLGNVRLNLNIEQCVFTGFCKQQNPASPAVDSDTNVKGGWLPTCRRDRNLRGHAPPQNQELSTFHIAKMVQNSGNYPLQERQKNKCM